MEDQIMSKVTINGKEYTIPEFTFDTVCELEENGVDLLSGVNDRKLATTVRGLVAWVTGYDTRSASREIQEHIENGGNIVDILNAISNEMSKSGFFTRGANRPQNQERRQNRKKNHGGNQNITVHSQN